MAVLYSNPLHLACPEVGKFPNNIGPGKSSPLQIISRSLVMLGRAYVVICGLGDHVAIGPLSCSVVVAQCREHSRVADSANSRPPA